MAVMRQPTLENCSALQEMPGLACDIAQFRRFQFGTAHAFSCENQRRRNVRYNRELWLPLGCERKTDMARALILVLDSVGIGGAPDAANYGDEGADTIGHIAEACARGEANRASLR